MPTWIPVLFTALLVISVIALFLARRGHSFSGPVDATSGYQQGTLTVTGLGRDNAADKNGQSYCTLSGIVIGPEIPPTEVYGTRVLSADEPRPYVGLDLPVVYKPAKVSSTWQFGSLTV
ncbi:hypothetical protein [Gordonia zhaorongruii]|uniref:hypothetical protein n=1 Tax=Gordonia zhaorongruii TaxID=2597659 RepID=UPI001050E9F3|nr:hypothetical protein [Gordonia zhaorongruii]